MKGKGARYLELLNACFFSGSMVNGLVPFPASSTTSE